MTQQTPETPSGTIISNISWSRTLRVALPFVAGILLLGCAQADDPAEVVSEGATVQLLAVTGSHRVYLLRTGDDCELRVRHVGEWDRDYWFSLGRVYCDSARSLYEPVRNPPR